MNLKFFIICLMSLLALTSCVSNSSISTPAQTPIAKTASVTETTPKVKTPDGKIITLFQVSVDIPGPELDKIALTPVGIAPETDISIHLENTEEFNFVFYKKSEIDGTWEYTTEHMPVRDSIKVPTEKGTFVVCLAIVMKSGKSAKYFFAIDVR